MRVNSYRSAHYVPTICLLGAGSLAYLLNESGFRVGGQVGDVVLRRMVGKRLDRPAMEVDRQAVDACAPGVPLEDDAILLVHVRGNVHM